MKKSVFLALACLVCSVTSSFADATIRAGDSFDLRIGGVPSDEISTISSNYTVDGEGCLNMPYVGKIRVSGKTASEIQFLVERTYMDQAIFTHPTISLTMAQNARFVNVGGQVKSPGRVPYTADMTVFSAVNSAGDFTEFADQKKVRLMRGNTVQLINCRKIRENPSLDVKVLPGDNIQVGETFW